MEGEGKSEGERLVATYASIREKILVPKCIDCHSGPNSPHGLDLSSYSKVLDQSHFPPLVVPGKPEQSSLYSSVSSGKMPKNSASLSSEELDAISTWIKNGARENEDQPAPVPSPTPTGEPGGDDGPGSPLSSEPCDPAGLRNEPGVKLCSSHSEPHD